jgi:hypothetical protein
MGGWKKLTGRAAGAAAIVVAVALACAKGANETVTAPPGDDSDAGTSGSKGTDAGPADAGPDAGPVDAGPQFGGQGPWPVQNVVYDSSYGIQESPVVGMSTDETQNLWVATRSAVYLLKPGQTKFKRFDINDGLHLAGNPVTYCDKDYPDGACPIQGEGFGISEIVGGGTNEVFVGYNGQHNWSDPNDGSWLDPYRHSGMLDRVRLKDDGTIQVDRLQMMSGDSAEFWHNRDVMRMVYDHFKHPHELYVGTNHGITRFTPDAFHELPAIRGSNGQLVGPEYWPVNTYAWMADHLHPQACSCGPCNGEQSLLLGDWRGLAFDQNGDLLVGGRWAAGKILWVKDNYTTDAKGWFQRGGATYDPKLGGFAMGDPYYGGCGGSRPVWCVGREGDTLAISAVTQTPDGLVWFASGPYAYQGDRACSDGGTQTGDRDLGIASYNPKTYDFNYYTGPGVGMAETNVRDMVALPDGRLVLAGPNSGLVFWDPKTNQRTTMRGGSGLPSDRVMRLELDTMVNPPALHVSTGGGAVSIRVFP